MIRTCWVQKDTRPIQKARNKGPFLPEADHIPKQRTPTQGEVTKRLKQPPAPATSLLSSLLSTKNQLAHTARAIHSHTRRHVCVAGVLQASAAGVLAVQLTAPPARGGGGSRSRSGSGGQHGRRRDHVAGGGGGGLPVPDADERGEPGEAAWDLPAGAAEAAGARGPRAVPEAPVRGGGVQPAAGGAGAALLAPAPRRAKAARPEEAPEGGLPGAQEEQLVASCGRC